MPAPATTTDQPATPTAPSCQLSLHAADVFSWALEASGIPLVDSVSCTCTAAEQGSLPQGPFTLRLRSSPSSTTEWVRILDSLAPGETRRLDARDLRLDSNVLAILRERRSITLHLELADEAGKTLAQTKQDCVLLPAGQWTGMGVLPESLACFITPDHPALANVLKDAAAALEAATGRGGLDGYMSGNPDRVMAIAAALHAALSARSLTYVVPPASFEPYGQKIRLPHETLAEGLGCCLDTAVLWAALLERAGLGVILPVDRTHAWVGFWLTDRRLGEPVFQDPERLRTFVHLGEAMVLETTAHGSSFEEACRLGKERLENPNLPFAAIEVASARLAGFRPLPIGQPIGDAAASSATAPLAMPEPVRRYEPLAATEASSGELPRLERWKRRLLDLSLRNRMLNFRNTQASLRLLPPNLAKLEDALTDERAISLRPLPKVSARKKGSEPLLDAGDPDALPPQQLLADEFRRDRCVVMADEGDFEHRGTRIFREATTLEQETGSSSLYLALGLVAWREHKAADPRLAPLLLIPVALTRLPRGAGFDLSAGNDEPKINATLVEFLRVNWNIDLSALLGQLPTDESGLDVPRIFAHVRTVISSQPGWELREEAWLGFFSFQKHLLWEDLSRPNSPILTHPVVRGVLTREAPADHVGTPLPAPERMDAAIPGLAAPLPADSSQLAAVAAAGAGRTFVLEGPPGTGKSQTITNIIAHALTAGKRVLFVAEKSAALSVVQRRLDDLGLAPWCLEMHARKADKKEIVKQLKIALDTAENAAVPDRTAMEAATKADLARKELEVMANEIQRPRACGLSFYAMVELLARLGDGPMSEDKVPANLNPAKWSDLQALLDEASTAWPGLPNPAGHPLAELRCRAIPPMALVDSVDSALEEAGKAFAALSVALGRPGDAVPTLEALEALRAQTDQRLSAIPPAMLGEPVPPADCTDRLRETAEFRRQWSLRINLGDSGQDREALFVPLAQAIADVEGAFIGLSTELGRPVPQTATLKGAEDLHGQTTLRLHAIPNAMLDGPELPRDCASNFRKTAEFRNQWSVRFDLKILEQDLAVLCAELRLSQSSWFIPAWLGRRKAKKFLAPFVRTALPSDGRALLGLIEELSAAKEHQLANARMAARGDAALAATFLADPLNAAHLVEEAIVLRNTIPTVKQLSVYLPALRTYAEKMDAGLVMDPTIAISRAQTLEAMRANLGVIKDVLATKERQQANALAAARGDVALASTLIGDPLRAAHWVDEAVVLGKAMPSLRGLASSLDSLREKMRECDIAFAPVAPLADRLPESFSSLHNQLRIWKSHQAKFPGWCAWQRLRAQLVEAGLPAAVAALEAGRIIPGDIRSATLRSLVTGLADEARAASPRLAGYFAPEEARRRDNYRKWRDALREACTQFADQIVAKRARQAIEDAGRKQELAVLRHQIGLTRRHWPARRLAEEMPGLLCALKPCFLMSPQSVAQHLPHGLPPFDLVVFDEASQIPPWDAVGALARGKSAIVVGDSRQLPPTSFFARQEDQDAPTGEADSYEDLESLLDEMHAAGFRSSRLLWHYRSRSEDLIAFSNARYYGGSLYTFPCAARTPSLRLSKIQGTYDRADTRTNRAEAEAVVADILARMKASSAPTLLSIGVVTFSQAQQELILDLLDKAARGYRELEVLMDANHPEPLIVKNLENIQGDERDVILFSIGYGPDATGKFTMNFGPLNRQGGERRLNVAITRARKEITVHTILSPNQIDPTRTSARGVRDLRDFLAYAEARTVSANHGGQADALESRIREGLQAKGWKVVHQIGQGGWKMPMAVLHPEKHDTYLLGILTDGPSASRAPTVSDRECVRPDVLRSLGWRIAQVSCLEAISDLDGLVQRLDAEAKP